MTKESLTRETIHEAVRSNYGNVARTRNLEGQAEGAGCCGNTRTPFDYAAEELAAVPKGAYLGEGSGTPVRHAALRPGEVVVDLGSGAGMDSFLAANAVGKAGRVYGFDMTPEMLERARDNAAVGGYTNVSFEQADIEHLPLADRAADAVVSNCVINLTPDKRAVYREIFRVLRPGGRIAIADIVLRGGAAAIQAFRNCGDSSAWCACLSGALPEKDYFDAIRAAGFVDARIVSERPAQSQPGSGVIATAVTITARKPVGN